MAAELSSPTHPAPVASGAPAGPTSSQSSSQVRTRSESVEASAFRRVEEYFRALGLTEPGRLSVLTERIVSQCSRGDEGITPEAAVARAQAEYERFEQAVFGEDNVNPLWLRAFYDARPGAVLAEPVVAKRLAQDFGNAQRGSLPAQARFRDQRFARIRIPSWLAGLIVPSLLTVSATASLAYALGTIAFGPAELLWCVLFAFLFGVVATGCSTAVMGLVSRGRRLPTDASPDSATLADAAGDRPSNSAPLPCSVVALPIYHENAEAVFAAVAAMRESLANTPGGEAFEIFVLSDSRDPRHAAEEERAFRRVAGLGDGMVPVYYRRRVFNDRQKAGNLAEFFERWGTRYEYAVVLDADSLMRGDTIVELARRMEASPRLALLQAPLTLHRGETLFARAQQFAASTVGPVFTRGLAAWSGEHGNYYGHNAIVRVKAFLECCALPVLSGAPPFGGHVLSHDFVEAALLCRAGWEVRTAHDLSGSFEELPPTLPEYVARDRRWCQGNLQHLRILMTEGLQPMSRLHMLLGASAYLAGPAWLAFLLLGAVLPSVQGVFGSQRVLSALLLVAVIGALFGPRLIGVTTTLLARRERRGHGGAGRLIASALVESVLGALLSPLLMLHHTRIVLSIVLGRAVGWGTQQRKATGHLGPFVRAEAPATAFGVVLFLALWLFAPRTLWWLAPIWGPFMLAIPLSFVVSSRRAGRWFARCGLLQVPSERYPDELALRAHHFQRVTHTDDATRFRDLVLDPLLVAAQLSQLSAGSASSTDEPLHPLCERALRVGPAGLTLQEREALATDAASLRWLHRHAWQRWPVESWQMGRQRPQLPTS